VTSRPDDRGHGGGHGGPHLEPTHPRPAPEGARDRRGERRLWVPAGQLLQPGVARAPAAAGHPGGLLREDRRVPGSQAALEPGRGPDRRSDGADQSPCTRRARSPRSPRRTMVRWVDAALGKCREARDRRAPRRPVHRSFRAGRCTGERRSGARSTYPVPCARSSAARRRLVLDELLRVQLALVLRKRALERTAKGIVQVTPRASSSSGSTRRLAFPLTGAQRRVIDEITADLGRSASHAPAVAGRRGRRQDGGGRLRAPHRGAGRPPGGADGAHRGAGRTAPRGHPRPAGRPAWCPATPRWARCSRGCRRERPVRVELLTNRTTAANRRKLADALADG
jgi:hypothetical protein